ncbi:MAG: ZIP family metal transporter [Bacilli bacterium]|nr:ZIP family metal transporter [Bacilli bacterium]MDD4077386.1 ZIP family metal transporter [Bacilli bacterium]
MTELLISTFCAGFIGTGLGGIIASLFNNESQKIMSLLLSFAAGIMLSIVCFDLLPAATVNGGIALAVIATVSGIIITYLLNYLIDYVSIKRKNIKHDAHHTAFFVSEFGHSRSALLRAGILMVSAIALHNFPEGLSIGSSYSFQHEVGLILSLVIALHNIPEGMAIVVPLIAGGMRKQRAILLTAASGIPTVFGALLGYMLGGISRFTLGISLGIACGAMIYIVFGEILPQAILMNRTQASAFSVIFGLLLGYLLVSVL